MIIELPSNVVESILRYNDPNNPGTGVAALNAVAWIGEVVCAIVKARDPNDVCLRLPSGLAANIRRHIQWGADSMNGLANQRAHIGEDIAQLVAAHDAQLKGGPTHPDFWTSVEELAAMRKPRNADTITDDEIRSLYHTHPHDREIIDGALNGDRRLTTNSDGVKISLRQACAELWNERLLKRTADTISDKEIAELLDRGHIGAVLAVETGAPLNAGRWYAPDETRARARKECAEIWNKTKATEGTFDMGDRLPSFTMGGRPEPRTRPGDAPRQLPLMPAPVATNPECQIITDRRRYLLKHRGKYVKLGTGKPRYWTKRDRVIAYAKRTYGVELT